MTSTAVRPQPSTCPPHQPNPPGATLAHPTGIDTCERVGDPGDVTQERRVATLVDVLSRRHDGLAGHRRGPQPRDHVRCRRVDGHRQDEPDHAQPQRRHPLCVGQPAHRLVEPPLQPGSRLQRVVARPRGEASSRSRSFRPGRTASGVEPASEASTEDGVREGLRREVCGCLSSRRGGRRRIHRRPLQCREAAVASAPPLPEPPSSEPKACPVPRPRCARAG